MPNFEVNLDEMLGLIAKNSIIINRQDKALGDLSEAYNAKVVECDALKEENVKLREGIAELTLGDKRVIEGKFDKETVG